MPERRGTQPGRQESEENRMKKMEGIIVPCVTPFDETGNLRLDWLKENYKKLNRTDVGGYMALGSNGEFRSLSDDEAFAVIQAAAQAKAPDKVLIAGVGRESLYQTLAFIARVAEARTEVDYLSVLTPGYFKNLMTDHALIDYYQAIADFSPYPVLIYCAPGFANDVRISPEALRILADHPNIAGIKDTSPDMMSAYMDCVGGRDDFQVLAGSLNNFFLCTLRGGKGGILSAANYFPETCVEFCRVIREGNRKAAEDFMRQLKEAAKETGGKAGVAGVKAVMNLMGYQGGVPRKPVQACGESFMEKAEAYVRNHKEFIRDWKEQKGEPQ